MILGTLNTLLPECVAQIRDGGGNGNNVWNIFLLLMVQNTCEPAELGSLSNDSYGFLSKHHQVGPKGERLSTRDPGNGTSPHYPTVHGKNRKIIIDSKVTVGR